LVIKTESLKVGIGRNCLLVLALLITAMWHAAPVAAADNPESLFDTAITAARAGDHASALPVLRQLVADYPDNRQYLYDYITVLCWAGNNSEALALLPQLDLERTPDYVIDNLAPAAMAARQYFVAVRLYERLVHSSPDNTDYRLNLAWALLETGRPAQAYRTIDAKRAGPAAQITRLTNLAHMTRDGGAPNTSLIVYDKLVSLTSDPVIIKERIQLLSQLGAAYLGNQLAHEQANIFNDEEQTSSDGDLAATRINWRPLSGLEHANPDYETDLAIALLLRQLQQFEEYGTAYTPAGLRCQFDLITAWHDRQEMASVIERHQQLVDHGIDIPVYTREAIADAYLSLHQPDRASAIYRDILTTDPNDFDARLGLYYCLLDLDDYAAAQALIDDMAANEPAWTCDGAQHCTQNRRKLSLDISAAMTHAYAERPDLAAAAIDPLYTRAPNNPELRLTYAMLRYWRAEPHRALQEVELVRHSDADYFDAAENRFNLLMSLMDYDEAQRELETTERQFGDGIRQQKMARTWHNHNLYELSIDINRSTNTSSQDSNRELVIDSYLYGQPQRIHFRPYVHSYYTRSKIPEGRISYHRLGIGMEYRDRDIKINAETHANADAGSGVALAGLWTPLDHWSFSASIDSNDRDVPLRGRYNVGLTGRSIGAGIAYIHNEALRIDSSYKRLSFSDDNVRQNLSLSADRRLFASPHYLLNGRLGYAASTNTLPQAAASYYNPESDRSIELGLVQEWTQYRFYDASFRHRLETTIGRYYQSGFSSNSIWTIAYEQQWSPHENFDIAYGLGRSQRSYDAAREFNNWLMMRLDWRF